MRPLPEHRPSWLSTILFALVAFMFALVLGAGFVDTWFPSIAAEQAQKGDFWEEGRVATMFTIPLEGAVFSIPIGVGIAGAIIAGWAWRAPRKRRFQITGFSGFGILVLTLFDVCSRLNALTKFGVTGELPQGLAEAMLSAGALALFAMVLGVVLLLAALIQDRPK